MDRLKIPKSDYSQIAKHYDKVRPDPAPALVSSVVKYGKISKNSVILDVGCGTGRFTLSMPTVKLICGLEPSIEMLEQAAAKDKSKRVHWIRADGHNLPFSDNLFNCVFMTAVIHHMEHKDKALREIHRVLKARGTCVIMTFSHAGIKKHILHDFPGVTRTDLGRIPSIPSLRIILEGIGFKNVHYHVVKLDEGPVPTDEYLARVRNKYISTLTLLTENEFRTGFRIFEEKIRKKYGNQIRKVSRFVFVEGNI